MTDLLLAHALRVKGLAAVVLLADMVDAPVTFVETVLQQMVAEGTVSSATYSHMPHELFRLTEMGTQLHRQALASELGKDGVLQAVEAAHTAFLPYDRAVKGLCTQWQLRDGKENVHDDVDYDRRIIDRLSQCAEALVTSSRKLEELPSRFGRYAIRLKRAISAAQQGDDTMVAGALCNSFHDIWMELHQDFLLTLNRQREE
jgi:hypothetical protein